MFDYFSTKDFPTFPDFQWQTKDFDCLLETYSLGKDGKIYREGNLIDYTGTVHIYDFHPETKEWVGFVLTFFFGEFQSAHRDTKYDPGSFLEKRGGMVPTVSLNSKASLGTSSERQALEEIVSLIDNQFDDLYILKMVNDIAIKALGEK